MSSNDHRRRRERAESFRCLHCRLDVSMSAPGTAHRNHCPTCLTSKHVDDHRPGDRASPCHSRMDPIAVSVRGDGEWVLIHRCSGCDALSANRTAGDDNVLLLVQTAIQPLARPPFPLELLGRV